MVLMCVIMVVRVAEYVGFQGGLRSKFTKNMQILIFKINSLCLEKSVVQRKKFEKKNHIPKKIKKP